MSCSRRQPTRAAPRKRSPRSASGRGSPAAGTHLRILRAGWLNHVATRRCQSLWKWGFRIMPLRLGAMAAAACRYGKGYRRLSEHWACAACSRRLRRGPPLAPAPPEQAPIARCRPMPKPGPCQQPLRAQGQPKAPDQSPERPQGAARPAARSPASGWRWMKLPGRGSPRTHLPPRQMADRKRKRPPGARRKRARQWAALRARTNRQPAAPGGSAAAPAVMMAAP